MMLNLMLKNDSDGLVYQDLIERNLNRIVSIDIDLSCYYESRMAIHTIPYSLDFAQFHATDKELYIPVNFEKAVPVQTIDVNYDLVKTQLEKQHWLVEVLSKLSMCLRSKKQAEKISRIGLEEHSFLVSSLKDGVDDAKKGLFKKPRFDRLRKDAELEEVFEIEYQTINMAMLLKQDSQQFINLVKTSSDKDISVLEIEAVKLVVEFKWNTYTRGYFIRRFLEALMFIIWFIIDIIYTQTDEFT